MSTTFAERSGRLSCAAFESAWFDDRRVLILRYPTGGYSQRYLALSRAAQAFDPRMCTAYLGSVDDGGSYFEFRHPGGYESLTQFTDYLRDERPADPPTTPSE